MVAISFGSSTPAHASPTYPDVLRAELSLSSAPPCAICHQDGRVGLGTVTTSFGRALIARGLHAGDEAALKEALAEMTRDRMDSDGDGVTDLDALRAGRDPNGAGGVSLTGPDLTYGCGGATVASSSKVPPGIVLSAIVLLWV